ncbi:hypothetical protein ACLX1H_001533 [Fusarium chlamydosporum]
MIASIYSAVTGFGEALRSYLSGSQVSGNEHIKGSSKHNGIGSFSDDGLRWVDRDGLISLMEDYKTFSKSFTKVWECLERGSRQEANKDLAPLSADILDSKDRNALHNGQARDLTEVFAMQLKRAFQFLDRVYEIRTIVRIRDNNQFVPSALDYGISPDFAGNLESIMQFLSSPALHVVCKSILQKHREYDCEVSQSFLDRIALDIQAILHNLPAPSYVDSQEYRRKLQTAFTSSRPSNLNTHLSLPGSFPEFDEPKELAEQQPALKKAIQLPVDKTLENAEPSSTRPIITRPSFFKTDSLRADLAQNNTNRATFEDYRRTFHEEPGVHHVIKSKYINSFAPKAPLTTDQIGSVRSILRSRRKHPFRTTPKRLGMSRRPKAVRFTEDTVSPRPRTHLGLEVPKKANYSGIGQSLPPTENFQEQRPSWARQLFKVPTIPIEERPRDSIFASSNYNTERIAAEKARLVAEAAKREAEEKARQELEERLARSGGLRAPNQILVAPVSSEWHQKAMSTLRAAPAASLAKSAEGIDLRRHDFAKVVSASEWLNDEIVNASLLWLDRAINSAAGIKDVKQNTRKCFTLGSFFFKRLQDQGVRSTQRTLRRHGVEKRNFLDVDTILLPICEHSHWTLIVIRPSKRTVAHMDSINAGGNSAYVNRAMAWIKDVLEEKFIQDEWKVVLHEAPLQNNGHDCGVHTITNAMCISLGLSPIDSYTATDMPAQRIRIACMLLNGGFTGDFDLRVY